LICGAIKDQVTVVDFHGSPLSIVLQTDMSDFLKDNLRKSCNAYPVELASKTSGDIVITYPRAVVHEDGSGGIVSGVLVFRTDGFSVFFGTKRKAEFLRSAMASLKNVDGITTFLKIGSQYRLVQ
jgi:hypothetical protein